MLDKASVQKLFEFLSNRLSPFRLDENISVCYCVPEFGKLSMDSSPDVSSLLSLLKDTLDVDRNQKSENQQVSTPTSGTTQKIKLQSTSSTVYGGSAERKIK